MKTIESFILLAVFLLLCTSCKNENSYKVSPSITSIQDTIPGKIYYAYVSTEQEPSCYLTEISIIGDTAGIRNILQVMNTKPYGGRHNDSSFLALYLHDTLKILNTKLAIKFRKPQKEEIPKCNPSFLAHPDIMAITAARKIK